MKKLEVGRPIELDETTAQLMHQISAGEWGEIDRQTLRSIVPDTDSFVKFLKLHKLTGTAEAKVVLERLGIVNPAPAERFMVAGAGAAGTGYRSLSKQQTTEHILVSAAKKMFGKPKRRKAAKPRRKFK